MEFSIRASSASFLIRVCLCIGLSSALIPGLAYNPFTNSAGEFIRHDNSQPVQYYINLGSYASAANKADLIQGIRNAFQHVQDNPFINVTFTYLGETSVLPAQDGVSVVYLDGDRSYVGGSAGVTMGYNINASSVILSADIALNGLTHAAQPFTNLYALALHELCHFLGLSHSSSGNDSAVYDSTVNMQLSADDIAGLATMYPDPSSPLAAQRGTVEGRVTAADGTAFSARIVAYDLARSQPRVITVDTKPDGTYRLPGLPAGTYNIVAETLSDSFVHLRATSGTGQAVAAGTLLAGRDFVVTSPGHLAVQSSHSLENAAVHPGTGIVYATQGYNGPVKVIDLSTGQVLASLNIRADDLAFTQDGRRLVIVSQIDRRIALVDTETGSGTLHQVIGEVTGLPSQPISVAVKGSSMAYVSCNGGGAVVAVSLSPLAISSTIMTNEYNQAITLAADGLSVFLGTYIGTNNWIEIDANPASPAYHTIVRKFPAGTNQAWQVVGSANGQSVFVGTQTGVDVRRRSDNLLLAQIPGGRSVYGMALSTDGSRLAFLGRDAADLRNNELILLDTASLSIVERVTIGGSFDQVARGGSSSEFLITGGGGLVIARPSSMAPGGTSVTPAWVQTRSSFTGGQLSVSAANSALWQIVEDTPWLAFQFTSFRGSGQITYSLEPNLLPHARSATISAAGQTVTIVQGGIEEAPLFSVPAFASALVGTAFSLAPVAQSPVSSFAAKGLPAWLSLDPVTGTLTGTPAAAGTHAITLEARNAAGSSFRDCFLTVTTAALPDLVIESARATAVTSSQFTLEWTLRNAGTAPVTFGSPNVIFQKYISADTIYNNSGDMAAGGYLMTGTLQPGQTISRTEVTGRSAGSATHPYIVAKIDSGSGLAEANEANNTLAVAIEGLDFALWKKAGWFTTAEQSNASISGPDADPDKDGRANWLEYAFDFDPRIADSGPHNWVSGVLSPQARLFADFSFRIPLAARKDVRYELLAASELGGSWAVLASKQGTGAWQGMDLQPSSQQEGRWARLPVTDTQPLAGITRRFVSIRASPAP